MSKVDTLALTYAIEGVLAQVNSRRVAAPQATMMFSSADEHQEAMMIPSQAFKAPQLNRAAAARRPARRCFQESIDMQVNLNTKRYDPCREKRFSGSLRLPHLARPSLSVCIMCDLAHEAAAKKAGLPVMTVEDLKRLNKNKKLVKKAMARYDAFLASDTIIRTIPRLLGPTCSRIGKFPSAVAHNEDLAAKVAELQSTIKFQMKKVPQFGVVVGHARMGEKELRQNVVMSINFLISLLRKGWWHVKSIYLKSTMGEAHCIYGRKVPVLRLAQASEAV